MKDIMTDEFIRRLAGPRAVVYSFSRRHLRHVWPRNVRRELPVPRLHGRGDALVLGPGLARHPLGWAPGGHDAHRLLPATRIQCLRSGRTRRLAGEGGPDLISQNRLDETHIRGRALRRAMTLPSIRQHMQSHNREDASGCHRRSSDQQRRQVRTDRSECLPRCLLQLNLMAPSTQERATPGGQHGQW